MNSLTYVSRQFDVLVSTSAASARSAPPSPSSSSRQFRGRDGASMNSSTSLSTPEIRSRTVSDSSARGSLSRSKARAFLRGPPRKRALSNLDPADVPLPPSPSTSSVILPESHSNVFGDSPTSSYSLRSSSNPGGRRRRKEKRAYDLALRPFVSIWRLLLSLWLWVVGNENRHEGSPLKRRMSSNSHSGKGKQVIGGIGTRNRPLLLSPNAKDDPMDEQSDETLVDSDDDEEGDERKPLILNMSSKRSSSRNRGQFIGATDDMMTDTGGPDSFTTSASILLPSGPTLLGSASSSTLFGPNRQTPSSANKIRISLPQNATPSSSEGNRKDRKRITPFPSREHLGSRQPREEEDEETKEIVEVDASLHVPSSSSSSLSIYNPSTSSSTQWIAPTRQTPPTTIVTPPSTESLSPPNRQFRSYQSSLLDSPLSPDSSLPSPSAQQLLPNRLGNSYLLSAKKGSRRPSPDRLAAATASLTDTTGSSASSSRQGSIPRTTPFHLPKTLVLDLDETLIHSASSRSPLPPHPSAKNGGVFGDLGGLFIGGGGGGGFGGTGLFSSGLLAGAGGLLGRDKDRVRSGHMIEVVLNGRSTLYTVYKRPFVDYFLRKVRTVSLYLLGCTADPGPPPGLNLVHFSRFHRLHARVCGSCD